MKKFRFKFQAVETMRKSKEREALRSLATAQRALQTEKDRKKAYEHKLQESLTRRQAWPNDSITPNVIAIEDAFVQGTKHRIHLTEQAIRRAERTVEKVMAHYLYCRQQLGMIEKLKDKAFAEYREARSDRERKVLDDLYVMRAKRMESGEAA